MAGLCDATLAGETSLDALDLSDDAAVDAWMDAAVTNDVHSVGTCRMGSPDIPRANTHLTTVAIAERVAADLQHDAPTAKGRP